MNDNRPLRIRSIEVKNFKSLVDFKLPLSKLTCLIGLNGAGKTTVLQFIDFLSQLVRGDMAGWLEERQWKSLEMKSKLLRKNNIEFCVQFEDSKSKPIGHWEAHYSPHRYRCTWERIELLDSQLEVTTNDFRLEANSNGLQQGDGQSTANGWTPIPFKYQGSILSALKDKLLPEAILHCKSLLEGIESLDMLTPERLRQRTRTAKGSLGHGGRNLSSFVFELGPSGRKALAVALKRVYPSLKYVNSKSLRSGWKQLYATENFTGAPLLTEAPHLNDGMLRMIAILAEINSQHGFLLFDEIENGINPEVVEFLIDSLVKAKQQVVVTTHSPMILNYLDDQTAMKGVIYLYKSPEGHSKSIPFFSIPSLKKKLEIMGPGEAFVDTNLSELAAEIDEIAQEEH